MFNLNQYHVFNVLSSIKNMSSPPPLLLELFLSHKEAFHEYIPQAFNPQKFYNFLGLILGHFIL